MSGKGHLLSEILYVACLQHHSTCLALIPSSPAFACEVPHQLAPWPLSPFMAVQHDALHVSQEHTATLRSSLPEHGSAAQAWPECSGWWDEVPVQHCCAGHKQTLTPTYSPGIKLLLTENAWVDGGLVDSMTGPSSALQVRPLACMAAAAAMTRPMNISSGYTALQTLNPP